MSILYIRPPSRASAESAQPGTPLTCMYALASDGGAIEREGSAALSGLSSMIEHANRVVLLLAASDVTLLRVKVPTLSASKLKTALPNLVEDQLISDPAECVLVSAAASTVGADGMRCVAIVQRAWLELLTKSLAAIGARNIAALPAQLCLPYQAGSVTAVIGEPSAEQEGVELSVRMSEQEALGLPVMPEHPASAARDLLGTLRALVPALPVHLFVPQSELPAYQSIVDQDITLAADQWQHWVAGAKTVAIDLMSGLGSGTGGMDWQRWRWPLILTGLALTVHIGALDYDWWRLKREADALTKSMVQIYKTAYPKETVILNPMDQMRQKIAAAKLDAGQAAPDDFTTLTAAFGEAWSSVTQNRKAAAGIGAIEYKERNLLVRLKSDGEIPFDEMKAALAARNLNLSQKAAGVWQIRSGK